MKYASARKIPHLRALLILAVAVPRCVWGQAPDSNQVYRVARTAESEYERAARRLAPLRSSDRSGTCDEYVGRFCLYYDAGRDPLPAEPVEITAFRERAIGRLTSAFELNPARAATAFPLIRLLLEQKRPRQALAVAQRFRAFSNDTVTGSMLVTLGYHASGDITAAERTIEQWLAVVDSGERRRLKDLKWLITNPEEKRYRALTDDSLATYETRYWRYADALYLTAGNEIRTEHFSRHAESKLVAAAPTVHGSTSWGNDVAELTIRFGTPKARTRLWPSRMGSDDLNISEHWDPEQLIYAPPALDTVLRVRARPAAGWPLDTIRSITGHAPSVFRRMLPLEHQANIFRSSDGNFVLRVDGVVKLDSTVNAPAGFDYGLFLLDEGLREVARHTGRGESDSDSLRITVELPLPHNASFYSAEILEKATRLAARARFLLDRRGDDAGLFLSDILVAEPFQPGGLPDSRGEVDALPALILPPAEPFGVYAEASLGRPGPDSVRVELEIISIDGSPAVVRAARWLGQRLGLSDPPPPRRLTWSAELYDAKPHPLAVTVDPGNLKPGRYIVEMAIGNSGRRVVARREIVFSASATSSPRP